jgi:hypothetical protein
MPNTGAQPDIAIIESDDMGAIKESSFHALRNMYRLKHLRKTEETHRSWKNLAKRKQR